MDAMLIDLLKNIENLSDDDLEKVKACIEFILAWRAAHTSDK